MRPKIKRFIATTLSIVALATALVKGYLPYKTEAYIKNRVVRIASATNSCSGEQVRGASGEDYILTAAHCFGITQDPTFYVTTEDGRVLKRKVIAEDIKSDLLLLEGVPGLRGLDTANYYYRNMPVRSFTHGDRLDTYKTEGVLIQHRDIMVLIGMVETEEQATRCQSKPGVYEILDLGFFIGCIAHYNETATTALIVPGSSGGPVVNDMGSLVGVVSAGGDNFGYLVNLDDIQRFLSAY